MAPAVHKQELDMDIITSFQYTLVTTVIYDASRVGLPASKHLLQTWFFVILKALYAVNTMFDLHEQIFIKTPF